MVGITGNFPDNFIDGWEITMEELFSDLIIIDDNILFFQLIMEK